MLKANDTKKDNTPNHPTSVSALVYSDLDSY